MFIAIWFCYSEDGGEYTGSRSSVIISSQISDDYMTFLGNSSVILNFTHNVSNKSYSYNHVCNKHQNCTELKIVHHISAQI